MAYTVTVTPVDGGQEEEKKTLKSRMQISPSQEEAGTIAEPQLLPKVESVYMRV